MTRDHISPTFRQQVFRGGAFLAARHAMGAVVSAGGTLLLTVLIGPADYGLFVAALGVFTFFNFVAQWGVNVYLIRREGPTDDRDYDVAFTLLLLLGFTTGSLGVLSMALVQTWGDHADFAPLAIALFAGLPIGVLNLIPTARIERAMDYGRLSVVEVTNVFVLQAASLAAAVAGFAAWSPVVGWWVQQVVAAVLLFWLAGYRPRPSWDRERAKAMLSFGLGYCASLWIWQLRSLLNTVVVLPLAGAAAVGWVGLATRFVEALSVVKNAMWRLSIAALTQLNGDRLRMLRALNVGMRLQVLGVGLMLAGFAVVAPYLMPLAFRAQWDEWAASMDVFPYIALGVLVNAMFSLHTSVLYVLNRNWLVTLFHATHVGLLFVAARYFVPHYGVMGVGYAEIVAIGSYFLIHLFVKRVVGAPEYGLAAVWVAGLGLLLFAHQLGWIAYTGVVAAALWPPTWRALREYVRLLRPITTARAIGEAT